MSLKRYSKLMSYEIETTPEFDKWLSKLKDKALRSRIDVRFNRIINGHFGDSQVISSNLFELRFFFGSGYRVYYTIRGGEVVILLCGGDKSSQRKDIEKAQLMIEQLEN